MDVVEHLARAGGIAGRLELVGATGRTALAAAVANGAVLRVARGRYALPTASVAQQSARELTGTAVLLSAAAHWGWRTKWQPARPQVAVGRGRKVAPEVRQRVDVRWRGIPAQQVVDGWVTSRVRTVHDCCALLPFDEALSVVDSALRDGRVTRQQLLVLDHVPPRLRARVARVVAAGDSRAANPFESVLRSVALGVPGLSVRPQFGIRDADGWIGRVDLADEALRIVLEADSHEFHTEPEAFARDCWRYDRLVADDWVVLRFPWLHVMNRQEAIHDLLARVVARRQQRCRCGGDRPTTRTQDLPRR
jgi:very-short-patch-repair endonuclease